MSLFRQLWLAVIASTLIAFAGSFVASMLTARHYLEQQLAIKNNDNAASLALSMSQLDKDPVTVELQVAAVFDSGQYAAVRLIDPNGKTMIEKTSPPATGNQPEWFVRVFPIASQPGHAQVSAGWNQFGTIELISHSQFAYKELWDGALKLLAWFAVGGGIMGLLGMQVLRRIRRPLDAVVGQAQAISERRFISIPEPKTPELKSLASAMNAMVDRLKAMFAEEAARLEQVRREATLDSLTGLANRDFFMNELAAALSDDDASASGTLLMLRLGDLAGINRRAGRETADEVLRRIGATLKALAANKPNAAAARLNGADFALLLPGVQDPALQAEKLLHALSDLAAAGLIEGERIGYVASGTYLHGQAIGSLLSRVDAALASAETQSGLAWCRAESSSDQQATSNADWKKLLDGAIDTQRLRLIEFPVAGSGGQLLHLECPLRLQATEDGEWLTAGAFMPMASRLSMTTELDLSVVRLALDRIAAGLPAVAVNLSGESILDASFRARLYAQIAARRDLAPRLWMEVSEIGAFQHFEEFHAFCDALRPLGCRLGIEHFGRQFSEIGRLHRIGLDYLKVDGSFIRAIDSQPGNQAFLKGLCSIAHNIGLTVIAEGVQTAEELAILPELGFDGATGPAVPRN
ncbi:bifunctional diguanylate cyclase/phosphodiesterase [Ferribacterium limneticum]|uniref:bifunctional diguanylate cyclase/phosphodiesterase n=1 Tax=Ferribacterium limneticum TaxID=76259 RepID=UPI001CFB9E06|nr:EAL domain-containing protein [Ferribacterium limneticum]UCV29297.1 EAL domain-containing protein [Ferribacterium limneticum]UCV33216.1 EAL domain-containing protein [Ferribacterium limneticum]